ncbi:sigma factor-like helix-turn-helix DNA-binding protein [Luedemannella helvata]|uniref:RNA polymerase sigma factor 70 region 4 type 2 domain-containing protein n=1 Tax=Luedemannella helvata TaxID=349315 RepID=A0ABP4XA77_9ACTN
MRDPSFEEFVRSQLPTLGRHACALTGDARAAEDLVVTALSRLARWSRHTPLDELRPLSMGTLYRSYVRGGVLPARAGDALHRAGGALRRAVGAGSGTGTPFQRAIAGLPRDQRAVLVGTYVAQASDDDIAELIGRTPVAVRSLRYRGLRTLRAAQGPREAASTREAWVSRDVWTQETVHLPGAVILPDQPRSANTVRDVKAAGKPAKAGSAAIAPEAGVARVPAKRVTPPKRATNAPRALNPARGANSARMNNVGRAARATNGAGEVRRGGR